LRRLCKDRLQNLFLKLLKVLVKLTIRVKCVWVLKLEMHGWLIVAYN